MQRMSEPNNSQPTAPGRDEGGLRPPEEYGFWRKVWWWFDFLILVKLARLRFIAILVVIGLVITQWDRLVANYEKWTRPEAIAGTRGTYEFFCPMHPAVVRDTNKEKCPICFMPLSRREKGSAVADPLPAGVVSRVQLSPYRIVLAGVQTWPVNYEPLVKEISAVGYIEFNERGQRVVAARVAGRLDRLFVNETGTLVQANDVLASIYSPDLHVAARELLAANAADHQSLVESLRTRIELLGISDEQISEILDRREAKTHYDILSPISGHVIKKYVVEGQYVDEGAPLYDVADLGSVWIEAQIYEDDLAFLPVGAEHEIDPACGPEVVAVSRAFPGEEFRGRLTFIYPHVDQDTRTVTVRFELPNPDHKLRPGSSATVKLRVAPREVRAVAAAAASREHEFLAQGQVLAVPESAVIDTGSQTIIYRESEPGVYEGIEVTLGPRMSRADGIVFYPILAGLERGTLVVTNGSFLVDAETRLNPSAGSIYFGGNASSKPASAQTVRPTTPRDPDATIRAALATLPVEDRMLAESQEFCAVLNENRLGSMGTPIKLVLEGQTVFLCCEGCKDSAIRLSAEILEELKNKAALE